MIRSPFKVQKHKRFDYNPRFYNERKEKISQSRRFYGKNSSEEHSQLDFRGTFMEMRSGKKTLSEKLPLVILFALIMSALAYVRQGQEIYLYLSAICFPAYILLRLKSRTATHRKPVYYSEEPQKEEEKD